MTGIVLALLAAVMFSLRSFLTKKLAITYDANVITAISRIISLIPLVVAMLLFTTSPKLTAPLPVLVLAIFFILAGSFANVLQAKAVKEMPVSTFSSINQIGVFFSAMVSGLILKEYPNFIESACIIMIVVLAASISSPNQSLRSMIRNLKGDRAFLYIILSQLAYSASGVFVRYWLQIDDPFLITFYLSIGFAAVPLPSAIKSIRSENISKKQIFSPTMIGLGLVTAGAILFNFMAKKFVYASIVDTILSSSIVFTLLLGFIFLNEKFSKKMYMKFAAIAVGIALIAIL